MIITCLCYYKMKSYYLNLFKKFNSVNLNSLPFFSYFELKERHVYMYTYNYSIVIVYTICAENCLIYAEPCVDSQD